MTAPDIETARLRLRAHRASDHDALAAMWADPLTVRYIGGTPSSRPQTWIRILSYLGHWQAMGFGYWAVEDRATGHAIGEGGLADFRRDLDPRMDGVPELGFALAPEVHGRGYGGELAAAVVAWADDVLHAPRTVCIVSEENAPSLRIVERLGYRTFDRREVNGQIRLLLERTAPAANA